MTSSRTMRTACVGLVMAAAGTSVLAGCGSRSGESGPSDTDIAFATAMTQHHAQTLQLLNQQQSLRLPPDAVAWTDPTRADRLGEIEDLTQLLEQWDQPVPATGLDHASEGEEVVFDDSVPGVLGAEAMSAVRESRGSAFEPAWFQALIKHERGAVELAREEVREGEDPAAVRFAKQDLERHEELLATLEQLAPSAQ